MNHPSTRARVALRILLAFTPLLFTQPANAGPPDPLPEPTRLAREGKHADAAALLDTYLKANRFDSSAWSTYGFELHADKQYDRGMEAFKKAAELGFFPNTQYYNCACACALSGRK